MTLQWVAASLLTGDIIADLPGIELDGPLVTTIGQTESVQMALNLDANTNPDWLAATLPGGSALVAYTGTNDAPTVVWGGVVLQRVREPGSPHVALAVSTGEAYLDACQVGTYTASDLNQDTILQGLMAFAMGTNRPPWTLNHLANASTQTQSVAYTPSSQTTVYQALQALSAVQGGPEWSVGWSWDVAAGTITPTLTYGARIGQAAVNAQPNVTIETTDLQPGSAFSEDYSPGMGANVVTAYGSAAADATSSDVPMATATAANLNGRPLWTYGYQPNGTVTDAATLGLYAAQAVIMMGEGAQPLTMVIANDLPGKRFGVDWQLGDDIGWVIDGPAFPTPSTGTGRVVSYRADLATITPILKGLTLP